jgi:hypothetical protein
VLKNLFEEEHQIHIMIEGRFLKLYEEIDVASFPCRIVDIGTEKRPVGANAN